MFSKCHICGLPKKRLLKCSECEKKVCIECMGSIKDGLCINCFVDNHFKTLKDCYTSMQLKIQKLFKEIKELRK